MSLRLSLALLVLVGCGGETMKVRKGEPQTAREKMLAEEKAHPTDADDASRSSGKKWSGWRYQGDRKDCFFLVGKKCFKTEKAACSAAKCRAPGKCHADGGGPAIVKCVGGPKQQVADEKPAPKPKKKK
jgi:hypothetical protein